MRRAYEFWYSGLDPPDFLGPALLSQNDVIGCSIIGSLCNQVLKPTKIFHFPTKKMSLSLPIGNYILYYVEETNLPRTKIPVKIAILLILSKTKQFYFNIIYKLCVDK
uniref:Uncharacterized protein n=1 Tax=Cacopsylla melanoneura TaxID=428564 RepID=A0A8D8M747_9HEMI